VARKVGSVGACPANTDPMAMKKPERRQSIAYRYIKAGHRDSAEALVLGQMDSSHVSDSR
jgi:hypothetical protein